MSFVSLRARSTSLLGRFAVLGVLLGGLMPSVAHAATPDPFTFVVRTGVATNVVVTSESKTLTGFTGTLAVSISGAGSPQYKVGSGIFTSTPGTISAGQTLTVRHTSSASASTETLSTVTVGDYSTPFKSVTGTTDRTPDAFDFGTKLNTFPNTLVASGPKTLTGYNTAVSIVPGSGAQYTLDGGATWTNASGTLNPGQALQMRHLTSSNEMAYTKTSLTVGGVTGYFTTRNRSATNQPPVANAGADQSVDENAAVTLAGSGSDAEGAVTYAWTQLSGPSVTLTGASTATAHFSAPQVSGNQILTFRLTVTDDAGATAVDDTQVAVVDHPPVANAGADQSVDEGAAVTLNGSASQNAQTYSWSQTSGPTVSLNNASTASATFTAPNVIGNQTLTFRLTVSDGTTASAVDEVQVNVIDHAPTANAGGDQEVAEGAPVTLAGSATNASIYSWSQTSGPAASLNNANTANASFTAPDVTGDQTLVFRLTATDAAGASATDDVQVRVLDTRVVSISNGQGVEGTGLVGFPVTFTPATLKPTIVEWRTTDGTAKSPADFNGGHGQFAVPVGTTAAVLYIQTENDSFDENDETFTVALSNPPQGTTIAATGTATGTIVDDDTSNLLRVGAGKHSIQPTQAQIDGIMESRLGASLGAPSSHLQKFNLGGFGLNPLQNVPDPVGNNVGERLVEPASRRVYQNSNGVNEDMQARAFVIEQTGGARVVFVVFDAVGAGNIIEKNMTAAILAATQTCGATHDQACFTPENIIIGMTHSHAGPDLQGLWGGVPQQWVNQVLYPGAVAAVTDALRAAQPAHLRMAQGLTNQFNNYRRPQIDPNADSDGHLTLLNATADDGTPIGNIMQYAAHPTGIGAGDKPRTPHPDFILGAMQWLEGKLGGTSLYYNGPIADASGSGERAGCSAGADGSFGGVRCRGEGIADAALAFFAQNSRELEPSLAAQHVTVMLPVTNPGFLAFGLTGSFNRYYDFAELPTASIPGIGPEKDNLPQLTPTAKTEVSRVTLGGAAGGLEIVTIPGEGTNTFGEYIRRLAKTDMMILGLTHNSFGYIVPEEEFSYVDQEGDDGLVAPFTGYEENVSLGPLTAPILRSQAYNVLFAAGPEKEVPPMVAACLNDSTSPTCVTQMLQNRVAHAIDGFATCVSDGVLADGCPLRTTVDIFTGYFEQGCQAVTGEDPDDPNYRNGTCYPLFHPDTGVGALPVTVSGVDTILAPLVARTAAMGCDFIDPSNCLYPFPNDFFTVPATPGTPQAKDEANPELGGTGRRVDFNPLGMPRNSAGKPVDPSEWNRNDGFSPGQMIVTYAPGLKANADGTIPGAVPITDIAQSYNDDAPIFVIDADTGERQLIWSEIDLNANLLLIPAVAEVGRVPDENGQNVDRPLKDGRAALIIRPAKNFKEGHRYIVALRNLKDGLGKRLIPSLGFRACRGDVPSALRDQAPMKERCDHINDLVGTLAHYENSFRASDLYLTWDFTVASAKNDVGRLTHMRDDAFAQLGDVHGSQPGDADYPAGRAPTFTIDRVAYPGEEGVEGGIARRIEGTITVPSYVVPDEPTPADNAPANQAMQAFCHNAPEGTFRDGCYKNLYDNAATAQGAALPPARLFYNPADAAPTSDPSQARYGDGMPDSVGTMQTRFICQIPTQSTPANPARAGIYGHGLLDSHVAITYDGVDDLSREYNYMFCAVDLYGFAAGDLGNVASQLVDVSNFPVVPDASQQGLLNYMFLARLIAHPQGFAANAAFQAAGGAPLFDRREVFYDGNSQGGIVGGAVLAISKDVNRGVLGSPGMNYSTLLQRSKDFDAFSPGLYASYTDPLDRMFLFSMIQMLWDRSENNGYAEHLTQKSLVEQGPVDAVLLQPQFGDQEVSMWSADVMGRTMDVPVDYRMDARAGKTYPDRVPGYPQPAIDYSDAENGFNFAVGGSALMHWADTRTVTPPIGNIPPPNGHGEYEAHDDPAKRKLAGRCQKEHFLAQRGRLLDVNTDFFKPEVDPSLSPFSAAQCPARLADPAAPGAAPLPGHDFVTAMQNAFGRFADAMSTVPDHLTAAISDQSFSDLVATLDAALAGTQQLLADVTTEVSSQAGSVAGIGLTPGVKQDPELPAPLPLMAGAAKRPIHVPVGTPLGGYLRPAVGGEYIGDDPVGEVTDNQPGVPDGCDPTVPQSCQPLAPLPDELRKIHSPYANASPPSRGYYDSLLAKAVALYDGHDYVVMIKTDFIGMLDEVVQDVRKEVRLQRGIDLGEGLIMSATHTHDGPGALANNSTRYFWAAMDLYEHDVYRKVIKDLAAVAIAAIDDLRPARIGHAVGRDELNLNHYRRAGSREERESVGYDFEKDEALRHRIGLLRIDDAATGEPMALVINFADHGIAFDIENQYFSGDVLGSIEREVEQTFVAPAGAEATYRGPIAMLVQNTGGDVTPSTDYDIRGIERLGKRMAPQVRAIADSISAFDSQPDLRTVSQRIILNRERLGYKNDEYPYPWGAAQCGNDISVPYADDVSGAISDATGAPRIPTSVGEIPGYGDAGLPTKHPYCVFSPPPDANDLADNGVAENGAFLPQDTILKAAKIGDITLMVQPGEPLTEYGVRLMAMAQGEGFSPSDTFVWGYSGDHVGYILPPVKEDWERFGGAESTTTFWGWKQGQRFIDVSKTLVDALRDGTAAPADEFQVDYSKYRKVYDAMPAAVPTPSILPGIAVEQPHGIKRFEKTQFIFEGGDPVVDFPNVLMVHADGSPVRRANGEKLDTFFEMHLKYRLISGRHLWTVEFEAPKDWATGTYRFKVSGKASQGTTVEYALESSDFAVSAASDLQATNLQCASGNCSVQLNYTPHPTNYRIIDPAYQAHKADQLPPVRTGSVTFSNGTDSVTVPADGSGTFRASITGSVSASGVDGFGNTSNTVTTGGAAPDADSDGVPDSSDTCPNTPAGESVDANGCSASQTGGGFPLCEDFYEHHCMSEVPVAGPIVQGLVDTVYNTVIGVGGGGLPDQCAPSGTLPNGQNCLHNIPVVGDQFGGGTPPADPVENASCEQNKQLTGGRSYQVKLATYDHETVSFQVLEPTSFDCANRSNGAHPLMLQGPGYGSGRSTTGFASFRDTGYTVISWDPRGFGDSTGTVRVMDPQFEGQYLIQILDWAEKNLDYLSWRDETTGRFVARPATKSSVANGVNLVVGSTGGSYGGGYQLLLLTVDAKKRLDALQPDITWHDLRNSLNPGDVTKSMWDSALSAIGEADGHASLGRPDNDGQDPFIKETLARGAATNEFPRTALDWFHYHGLGHWCAANGLPTMPYPAYAPDFVPMLDPLHHNNTPALQANGRPGFGNYLVHPAALQGTSVLLTQGMPDTLFNFNEAWWNMQCLAAAGADVNLYTHDGGHTLPIQSLDSTSSSVDGGACAVNKNAWFDSKLRGKPAVALDEVCFVLAKNGTVNDTVAIPRDKVLAPQPAQGLAGGEAPGFTARDVATATPVPNGVFALGNDSGNVPVSVSLGVVEQDGVLAGMAHINVTVSSVTGVNEVAQDCSNFAAPTRSGCDSITFVGLGIKKVGASTPNFKLVDEQVKPIRGLGVHDIDLVGVAERLHAGDELALLLYGSHTQFFDSYSRDTSIPAVNVSGTVKLPIYAVNGDGKPDPDASASGVLSAAGGAPSYTGGGLLGLLADFTNHVQNAVTALLSGDNTGAQNEVAAAATGAADDAQHLGDDPSAGGVLGTDEEPADVIKRAASANRNAEAVVLTGANLPDWSVPEARGMPYPHPWGVGGSGEALTHGLDAIPGMNFYMRNAHNGVLVYPAPCEDGAPCAPVVAGVPVDEIAAYAFKNGEWVEIPVQVDERMPYFLANSNSGFSFYSGTDQELTYVWDTESWGMTAGECSKEYGNTSTGKRVLDGNKHDITGLAGPTPDPIPGLDNDDEIVFMASDAGELSTSKPADVPADAKGEQVALADPLDPSKLSYVYLFLKPHGSSFRGQAHYVNYHRDSRAEGDATDADQWVDRSFFEGADPGHRTDIGTSNTGYGPNLGGTVCDSNGKRQSNDRFPRDGVTVSTDAYQWRASGRWMIREMHVAKPGQPGVYGPDLVDRWKGRAFQQSPDTNVSVVGFEDEQVNWEANSSLLGERKGPVRAIREIWGADSGTNVTKTETFYRDAVAYHYHVRVHPIPSDGLYTSWDYNRGAMIPDDNDPPGTPGGRYFTVLRPRGVPVDGVNDDMGNIDGTTPIPGVGCFSPDASGFVPPNAFGRCPVYVDVADPTFNLMLAFDNWEQVSGKGDLGSLVYTFENKGPTSYANPLVVPYYRDDACFDDGTGDDPAQRPSPGERSDDSRVIDGYVAAARFRTGNNSLTYADLKCSDKQGAYASHGVHYFFTGDTDNAFSPVTTTEIDGQQWQFAVPTEKPKNIAEPYANTVRVPLQAVVTPVAGAAPAPGTGGGDGFTAQFDFGVNPETDGVPIPENGITRIGATLYQKDGSGNYVPAANHLVTMVLERDCGGQQDPTGYIVECNAGGDHIARSTPVYTDALGHAQLELGWDADQWGSGTGSLMDRQGPCCNVFVHAMLVENGADPASKDDNSVVNYSVAEQQFVGTGNYAPADATDDNAYTPLRIHTVKEGPAPQPGDTLQERGLKQIQNDFTAWLLEVESDVKNGTIDPRQMLDDALAALNTFVSGLRELLVGSGHNSLLALVTDVADTPTDVGGDVVDRDNPIYFGYFGNKGTGQIRAGVGVVDMTPDVGYGAGQYSDSAPGRYGADPYATGKKQANSYGVVSRATGRAIVVEGSNGKRIALLKSDNYLAQDDLIRRVAQILEENNSTITYDQILYGVTHAHSTSYYSTPSWGVWAFQDAFDPRQFEYQARKLAQAILTAESNMKPARMGATTVRHKVFKGQIMHKGTGDDGTPVGYPDEYGDHGLVVMRFDDMTDPANPQPLAAWMNWGEHPEGLDGYDLHSADYVAYLERFVERDIGAPVVFSQGDVGSSEQSGNSGQQLDDTGTPCNGSCPQGQGVWRDWNHNGYAQNERNARFLADGVVKGWKVIGGELPADDVSQAKVNNYVASVQVPLSTDFPVDYRDAWVPGPLSHPYPSVSNCRMEPTAELNPGAVIVGLPDCERVMDNHDDSGSAYNQLKQAGVPVPEHYDAPAFTGVEENLRLKLQTVRLGDIVLGSCACEAQVDLILNFESRTNDVADDIYDGFDWACLSSDHASEPVCEQQKKYYDTSEYSADIPGDITTPAKLARMRAQVHNPANGWDAPEYVPYANAEPADSTQIKGNFTKEELPANLGYKLAVGVGHAGDYNGYTVSYREYMSHDHYRKALTSYGAHTADYMVTRLVRMAGAMHGGPELQPEPQDTTAQADEARQVAASRALGTTTKNAYEAYYAALPPDLGPAKAVTQPQDIGKFDAATFTWQGGATAIDNPHVVVELCDGGSDKDCSGGSWKFFADQTGEVQTRVQWSQAADVPLVYAGQFAWKWTANFEAYDAFPARLGSTPVGFYRFAVNGCINDGSAPSVNVMNRITHFLNDMLPADMVDERFPACRGGASRYTLESAGFEVTPTILPESVNGVRAHADSMTLLIDYSIPRTYASSYFPYLSRANDFGRFCRECSFRPWAISTQTASRVTVEVAGQSHEAVGSGRNWYVPGLAMTAGQTARITPIYADGRTARTHLFTFDGNAAPADTDHDWIADSNDNCPTTSNMDQADNDQDGKGNACDATPNEADGDGSTSGAPQLCAPGQIPQIGGECAADNGGEAIQEAVDTAYGAVTTIANGCAPGVIPLIGGECL